MGPLQHPRQTLPRNLHVCFPSILVLWTLCAFCVQEMFVQLGVVLYELVCGEKMLCGIMTTSQLVHSFRNRRLRPSLEDMLLDIIPLPREQQLKDKSNAKPHQQPRRRVDTTLSLEETRRCNSESTRRRNELYKPEKIGRTRSNSDVSSITHTVIDRLLSSCSKLCLQAVMEKCWALALAEQICAEEVLEELTQSLTLCCSATQWSPACIQHHVTALAHDPERKVMVWATALPRLHLGKLDLRTGVCQPQPISFLPDTMPHLRNRHMAVRSEERVMCMTIADIVGQLWVCLERNTSGAVYVFSLSTLEVMDSMDFDEGQDSAVLCAVAVPSAYATDNGVQYQFVLVGLACGQVLVFQATATVMGEEPRSPLKQCLGKFAPGNQQPCMVLSMAHNPAAVLCAFGTSLCPLEVNQLNKLLKVVKPETPRCVVEQKLTKVHQLASVLTGPGGKSLLDRRFLRSGIIKLLPSCYGVWLIQRHSHIVVLLDNDLQQCKLLLDIR